MAFVCPIIDLIEPTATDCVPGLGLREDLTERLDLGAVAGDGAGAVRFDQADGRRARSVPGRRPAGARASGPRAAAPSGSCRARRSEAPTPRMIA